MKRAVQPEPRNKRFTSFLIKGLSRESEEEAEVNETKPYQHVGAAVSSAERFRRRMNYGRKDDSNSTSRNNSTSNTRLTKEEKNMSNKESEYRSRWDDDKESKYKEAGSSPIRSRLDDEYDEEKERWNGYSTSKSNKAERTSDSRGRDKYGSTVSLQARENRSRWDKKTDDSRNNRNDMGSSPIRPVYNGSQVSLRSIYDQEKEENVEQKGSRRNSRIDSSFGPQRESEVRYESRGCSPIDFNEKHDSDNDSPKRRKASNTSNYRDNNSNDYGAPSKGRELPNTPPAEWNRGVSRQSEQDRSLSRQSERNRSSSRQSEQNRSSSRQSEQNRSSSRQSEQNNSQNNDSGDENEIPSGREIQNTPPLERNSRRFKDVEDPKNRDQDRMSTSESQGTSTAESSSSKRWGGKADKKEYESSSLPDSVHGSGKYSRYLQEEKKTKRSSRSSSQNQLSKPPEENALMRRKSYDASVRSRSTTPMPNLRQVRSSGYGRTYDHKRRSDERYKSDKLTPVN